MFSLHVSYPLALSPTWADCCYYYSVSPTVPPKTGSLMEPVCSVSCATIFISCRHEECNFETVFTNGRTNNFYRHLRYRFFGRKVMIRQVKQTRPTNSGNNMGNVPDSPWET